MTSFSGPLMRQAIDFRKTYGQELCKGFNISGFFPSVVFNRQLDLIEEEVAELFEAARNLARDPQSSPQAKVDLLKELADVVFVAYQFAAAFGLDLDEAMNRVAASNKSKLGEDGQPIRRADGKILKGPSYKPPVLIDLIENVDYTYID